MSHRPVGLLILDVREAVEKIGRYVKGLDLEAFLKDEKTIDAVVRNLEIIGEASRRLPDDFKERHADIEWRQIVGLRNRIVHEYFGVDPEIVWHILVHDLPLFESLLDSIQEP